jgi:hypothetical protein
MANYQILSDIPNGPSTRSVWALLKNGSDVRKIELILKNDEDADAAFREPQQLWQNADEIEDGTREWAKAKQRASDAVFAKLLHTLFERLEAGDDLPRMLRATDEVLEQDQSQKDIYIAWNVALDKASDGHLKQLIALMLTVMAGKLGTQ